MPAMWTILDDFAKLLKTILDEDDDPKGHFQVITKVISRSKSNSSGAKLGHLVKVSKIPFQ